MPTPAPDPVVYSAPHDAALLPDELEPFLHKAARSTLPVLLAGEFGTGRAQVARALHARGPGRDGPFVAVCCADPPGGPSQWCRRAQGGTLFLDGVDDLAADLQGRLARLLQQQRAAAPAVPVPLRVMASTTADLRQRVAAGLFSRGLLAELEYLCATVPPLRRRPADLEALVRAALARHGDPAGRRRSDEFIAACRAHAWPENLAELDRVVARLVAMTGDEPIRHADLMRHAPQLLAGAAAQALPRPPAADAAAAGTPACGAAAWDAAAASDTRRQPAPPEHWLRCAMDGDHGALERLHPGVRKALLYLAGHYAEPLSLGQLARQAHVSPSHLGFLLRTGVGATFKPLLQHIRVEKARQALAGPARVRVTEVALRVGFGDLSHFEKSFRRIVGRSPREYRQAAAGQPGGRPGTGVGMQAG
jgi:AraC-like DNA-binding protein